MKSETRRSAPLGDAQVFADFDTPDARTHLTLLPFSALTILQTRTLALTRTPHPPTAHRCPAAGCGAAVHLPGFLRSGLGLAGRRVACGACGHEICRDCGRDYHGAFEALGWLGVRGATCEVKTVAACWRVNFGAFEQNLGK